MRPIIQTLIYTGLRKSELLNLKWEHIQNDKLVIQASKTNKTRFIPMHPKLKDIFQKLPKKNNFVFTNISGTKLDETTLDHKFRAAVKRAKILHCSLHATRHTAASLLIDAGANIVQVKEFLGHSDIRTTMIYIHLFPSQLQETVDKISF
ncbi:MAG: site-specific integrase [Elusimicrobia bacterium]|nr:site-specific integrase [Elusimicrobiota bacterium]MBU2614250.1 site-specific integrase [Elusimicrobiota bacterium]